MEQTFGAAGITRGWDRVVAIVTSPPAARVSAPILIVIVWQLLAPVVGSTLLPMPAEVLEEMVELALDGNIWYAFGISFIRLFIGLTAALVVGVVVGLLLGLHPRAEAWAHDFLVIGLTFPYLIWGILVSMWFGFGDHGPVIVVFIAAVPYVIINIAEGVRDSPRDLIDMARSYDAPRQRILWHVVIPSLSPFFFAALRYGLANGWKGLVLAEVFAATAGAGWEIAGMRDVGNASGVIAYALYFAFFSILIERLVFGRLSAWVFRWRLAQLDAARTATT